MAYSLDTNIFIGAWVRHYPPDVFESFWEELERVGNEGLIRVSREVVEEIRFPEELVQWIKDQPIIRPTDEDIQDAVAEILAECPSLAQPESTMNVADPFVIGVAEVEGLTVVTDEKPRDAPNARLKIPDACAIRKVRCIGTLEFIREMGMRF